MINLENYEEYLILYVDDELDDDAIKALMAFLEQHPNLKKELELYQRTKLPLETAIMLSGKQDLQKNESKKIAIQPWWRYYAAAAALLLIVFTAYKWMNKTTDNTIQNELDIVKNDTANTITQPIINEPESDTIPKQVIVQNTQSIHTKPLHQHSTSVAPINTSQHTTKPTKAEEKIQSSTENPVPENPIVFVKEEESKTEEVIVEPIKNVIPNKPLQTPVAKEKKFKKGLLAKLFINAEKQEGLEHLKNQVEEKVATVKSLNENLKNTSVEFKIGNKELLVLNF